MDPEKSFIGNLQGMKELNEIPKRAHYQYTQGILQNLGDLNQCDLLVVWKSRMRHNFAMAVKKNSKFKSLNKMLLKMDERGQLKKLQKKYFLSFKECRDSNVSAVGMEKLASIFIFILVFVVFSLIVLIFEVLLKRNRL